MKTRRWRRWGLPLAGLLAVAAGAWLVLRDPAPAGAEYRMAAASIGDVESVVTALGTLEPKNSVDVGAQVSGQLQILHVAAGDRVAKGDLLAEIDPRVSKSKVNAARAGLKELEATLAQQRAELTLASLQAQRNQRLLKADAISRQDVEITDVALQVAKAKIAQYEAQIEKMKSTLDGDLASLEYSRIFAPMTGTVTSVTAFQGQTLNANQSAPTILTIADLTVMTVEADVSEADVVRLRPDMEAYFTTLGQPEHRWNSRLRQVLPQPETLNDVVLYKALLDVDNADGTLLPKMSAQVFFVLGHAENVVTVPLAALRQRPAAAKASTGSGLVTAPANAAPTGGKAHLAAAFAELEAKAGSHPGATRGVVLVLDEHGQPHPRPVLIGLKTRVAAEIVAGIEPGESVIVGAVTAGKGGAREKPGTPGLFGLFGGGRRG